MRATGPSDAAPYWEQLATRLQLEDGQWCREKTPSQATLSTLSVHDTVSSQQPMMPSYHPHAAVRLTGVSEHSSRRNSGPLAPARAA